MRLRTIITVAALSLGAVGGAAVPSQAAPSGCVAWDGDLSCGYVASGPGYYAGTGIFSVKVYHADGTYTEAFNGGATGPINSLPGERVILTAQRSSGCYHWYSCLGSSKVVAADDPTRSS